MRNVITRPLIEDGVPGEIEFGALLLMILTSLVSLSFSLNPTAATKERKVMSSQLRMKRQESSRRRVLARGVVAGMLMMGSTTEALVPQSLSGSLRLPNTMDSPTKLTMSAVADDETTVQKFRPNPVVVSAEAEALSHSETTMKLTPSYELFQMLTEEEGGDVPVITSGNALRDGSLIKDGKVDSLEGLQLSSYVGCGGKQKIEM